jgi:hypothetical protein
MLVARDGERFRLKPVTRKQNSAFIFNYFCFPIFYKGFSLLFVRENSGKSVENSGNLPKITVISGGRSNLFSASRK